MKEHENMGWECPKCGRCYSPKVEACTNCIKEDNANSIKVNISNDGTFIGGYSIINTTNQHTKLKYACTSFYKQGNSKYCANCGSHEKNHTNNIY